MDQDFRYREWLGERIESKVGILKGEGRGLWSLDTGSLEKLYSELLRGDPKEDFRGVDFRVSQLQRRSGG